MKMVEDISKTKSDISWIKETLVEIKSDFKKVKKLDERVSRLESFKQNTVKFIIVPFVMIFMTGLCDFILKMFDSSLKEVLTIIGM